MALLHIPLAAYAHFVKPITQLLLHNTTTDENGDTIEPRRPWTFWHPFVNVSITGSECSIVCPREQADSLFAPILAGLQPELQKAVSISKEDYSVIVIDGEGLEAGQRVLDLTSPLAMAKMCVRERPIILALLTPLQPDLLHHELLVGLHPSALQHSIHRDPRTRRARLRLRSRS